MKNQTSCLAKEIRNQLVPPDRITVLIHKKPGSELEHHEEHRDLVFKNLHRQGFSDLRLITSQDLSAYAQQTRGFAKLRSWVLYLENPDFVSPNYECLTREMHPSTLIGLRLEQMNNLEPRIHRRKSSRTRATLCFRNLWADGYCEAGALFTDRANFLASIQDGCQTSAEYLSTIEYWGARATPQPLPGATLPPRGLDNNQTPFILSEFLPALKQDPRPCLFLDRDGILNEDVGYPHRKVDFKGIEAIIPILYLARSRGFRLVVVTNQAGIAKERFELKDYQIFNLEIKTWLKTHGLEIDAWYFCPYHKSGLSPKFARDSHYRKPNPGMILAACHDYSIDLSKSFMVGDKGSDEILLEGLRSLNVQGKYSLASSTCPKFDSFEALHQFLLDAMPTS